MNVKYLLAAVVLMGAAGCGYRIKATTKIDRAIDLTTYDSFFILPGNSSGDATLDGRLKSSVERALLEKGWAETPAGEGQAAVIVHSATPARHTDQSFYEGWGGWQWRLPGPSTAAAAGDYKAGAVVVTIFDAAKRQAVWEGATTEALPGGRDVASAVDHVVAGIFDHFPVRSSIFTHTEDPPSARPAGATIIFSTTPSHLVLIDGDPVYRPVPGTGLERIANTRALIVRDAAGMCYLKVLDGWMQAYSIDSGWWSVSGVPPPGGHVALRQALASGSVDLLDELNTKEAGGPHHLLDLSPPTVIVARAPAQLIVTDGAMRFATIDGTSLQYVVNTTADVFREPTDGELYVLIAGRWFRSWKPEGPWQTVASGDLPADFARIPDGSPKAGVKATLAARRH